ncbi:histone deacetylase [Emticicia sp. C21]|uniref:histone deacetylase family protein n=1 Tax=Emticicia sp. C21 TaxID=2302915 RepID=UPI000E3456EF|nr:histone deacetylase [Emticicia sp. C21]RFS18099.1 histone deacetylase [Emticicia sp. C21]
MLKIAYDSIYTHPLPEGHRFPMLKYELIHEQLLYEGTCTKDNFFAPAPVESKWVLGVHDKQYFEDLLNLQIDARMERRIGLPVSDMLVNRELVITQGTIDCCQFAFESGISMNIAGGTHHAYADKGEGFCLLNDVAVASHYLLANKLVEQILVVDLDVHQGNGTALIFENDSRVFTFSMHGKENYPLKKEKSDLDIELPTYCEDDEYLNILYRTLPKLIEEEKPQFIFYISGVDILASDKLGKLKVSMEGCKQRDKFVFEQVIKNKIPIVVSMGGGYSPRIADIVEAHCNTFRLADRMFF